MHAHARRLAGGAARPARAAPPCRRRRLCVAASASPFKVQLLHPATVEDADTRPLLCFLPGTDGTGQALTPQISRLLAEGYDVRSLYVPPDDRSGWEQLQAQTLYLLAQTLAARPPGPNNVQVTLLAESFGGCLALRLAAAAPHLVRALVLLNPATCFNRSLNGLSSFVSATNLLGLFPQEMYNTAQAVLLPLLVDIDRVGPEGADALRSMIFMTPPQDFETAAMQQLEADEERDSLITLAAERRRLQTSSAAAFTTAGPLRRGGASRSRSSRSRSSRSSSSQQWGLAGLGGAGSRDSGLFQPAAAANFRSNLLRTGNLPDHVLQSLDVPTLLISSAKDRMLPSLAEGARLARLLPSSRRVILPDSGHAAMLERGFDLAAIMRGSGITPTMRPARAAAAAAAAADRAAAGNGGGRMQRVAATDGNAHGSNGAGSPAAQQQQEQQQEQAQEQQPVILGVVQDEALLGRKSPDGLAPPRSATILPPAKARRSPAGSKQQPAASPAAAARAGAALAAAAAATAGGALTAAADAGSSDVARAAASSAESSVGSSAENSVDSSMSSSDGRKQQQPRRRAALQPEEPDLAWDEWSQLLAPWRDLVSPVLLGQEHLPELAHCGRPLLFVGNHQKCGLYDMPLLAYELYMRGFKVKGLAHPAHWGGPLGPFFERFGAVPAGPMTAFKLLKANEQVLLFPGGAREVNKRSEQAYTLLWRDTPDFVRLAARCKAIIVPFAAVGADDAYDVMLEADDLLDTPVLGDLVKAALQRLDPSLDPREAALPLTRVPGLGLPTLVPIPNLQRLYFKVCRPVDTAALGLSLRKDEQGWQQLYDGVRAQVVAGMEELLEVQAADDQRSVGARLSRALESWAPAFSITQPPPDAPRSSASKE